MKKRICFFCILCLLVAVLLSACKQTKTIERCTYHNVESYILFEKQITVTQEDSRYILDLVNASEEVHDSIYICPHPHSFVCDGRFICYSSELGAWHDKEGYYSIILSEENTERLNKHLQQMCGFVIPINWEKGERVLTEQQQQQIQKMVAQKEGYYVKEDVSTQRYISSYDASLFQVCYYPTEGWIYDLSFHLRYDLTEEERLTVNAIFGYEENANLKLCEF